MRAKVTTAFPGVRDGEIHPKTIAAGTVIDGDLAVAAVRAGLAKAMGAAPENKAGAAEEKPETGKKKTQGKRK